MSRATCPTAPSHLAEEFSDVDRGIAECDRQGKAINLIVKRKDDDATVRVCHLKVATPTMTLLETKAF